MKVLALLLFKLYQGIVSPYWPGMCRYFPTCSHYSHEAITRYGLLKGSLLTLQRLGRCHPLGGRGYDPVS